MSRQYIDGQWVESTGDQTIDVRDAYHLDVMAHVPRGTADDVVRAVQAAGRAFELWSRTSAEVRARALSVMADLIDAHAAELAVLASRDVGTPIRSTLQVVEMSSQFLRNYAEIVKGFQFSVPGHGGVINYDAIGVVGLITPWNYPLNQAVLKIAPAIAAGCSMVVKPSEVAPLQVQRFVELVDDAGVLPPGVLNLVHGEGPIVGEALALNPQVAMVSLTGSHRAGNRVSQLAAGTVKRVTLELGGKSANILLSDVVDIQAAIDDNIRMITFNSGQSCTLLSRLLVPRDRLREAEAALREAGQAISVGDPLLPETDMGPVVSGEQYTRVMGHIRRAVDVGAVEILTFPDRPEHPHIVPLTVLGDVDPASEIATEEVFGPVLCLIPYDSVDEAVEIANSTSYGLAAAVWGTSESAHAVAQKLRAGMVHINGAPMPLDAPFGGFKHSGNGRERGLHGLFEYLEVKFIAC